MASRPQESLGTSQRFDNADVSHGSQLFQGIVNGNLYQGSRESRLQFLDAASGATFDAANKQNVPSCLENTRLGLLHDIKTWVNNHDQKRIYWLRGMAGTGKSTIALTISRLCAKERRLGASFFFSRGGGDLASANKFVATIAIQLAETIPDLREHIERAFVSDRQILDKGICNQWEKLVVNPLERLGKDALDRPIVIVVDALDECDDENDISLLVKCFEVATATDRSPLHIFITSRPESPINYAFNSIPHYSHQDFVLHNIEDTIVDEDLVLFYKDRLSRIDRRFGLGADSHSDHTIQVLVQRSHRLFIHAATACRFIEDGREVAAGRRLSLLIGTNNATLEPQKKLDVMYTTVLTQSWLSSIHLERQEITERKRLFSHIVGSIVVLFDVMPIIDLAVVLNTSVVEISQLLQSFNSVLDVPREESEPIRLLHPSFRDFLQDPLRCQAALFSIRTKDIHGHLLSNCLELMKKNLKRNMCNVTHPGARAQEITKAVVDKYLPRSVQYACRYWLHHLQHIDLDEGMHSRLEEFFNTNFLCWLESQSLLRQVPETIAMIRLLEARLAASKSSRPLTPATPTTSSSLSWFSRKRGKKEQTVAKQTSSLAEIVYDATRFLLNYASVIEEAPLQVYCSALLFSPEMSIMRKRYSQHIPTWISRRPVPRQHWNQYLQTLIHSNRNKKSFQILKPNAVVGIVFSSDKRLIVSGSRNGIIRVWAAVTGREQLKIQGPSGRLSAVAFSPNKRLIASTTKEGVLSIWSADTGKGQLSIGWTGSPWYHGEMMGKLTAVAFSPDSRLVTAVNGAVARVWNAVTGEEQCTVEGSLDWMKAIASRLSLPGQDDIQIWHRDRWSLATALQSRKTKAFSPDFQLAATQRRGCLDEIDLWDLSRSKQTHTLRISDSTGKKVHVAFSPDGRFVATGSNNMALHLWDTSTGSKLCTLTGHLDAVSCVAFSPDGQLTSGSVDGTVRLWDTTHTRWAIENRRHFPIGQDDQIMRPVEVSSDGRMIAWVRVNSSMADVLLWDTAASHRTYTLEADSELGVVNSITFSQDNQHIAVMSAKGHALWDVSTGSLRRKNIVRTQECNHVFFSSDSRLVVCCKGGIVEILDTAAGKTHATFTQDRAQEALDLATVTPDNRVIALVQHATIKLLDIATGQKIHELHPRLSVIKFSSDGQWMAARRAARGGDRSFKDFHITCSNLVVFDAATYQERYCVMNEFGKSVNDYEFSPDSRSIVYQIHADDYEVKREKNHFFFLELASGKRLHAFACYNGWMKAFTFSPDGQRIIWTAPDCTIRLWDTVTRTELCICSDVKPPRTMAISPCGTYLITDRGSLQLPSATPQPSPNIFASQSWIEKDGKGIIAIPPDHRDTLEIVAGNCVIFSDGAESVLEIDTSSSLMID